MDINLIKKKCRFILRRLSPEQAEDIMQDVIVSIIERKPDIKYANYYDVTIRRQMIEFLEKEKNLKEREIAYVFSEGCNVKCNYAPFNDLLYKELKRAISKKFNDTYKSASKQSELLDYLMVDGNEENSAKDIKQDLKFNNCDTAKANVRHIRLKLDEVKKLLKNEDK